MGFVLYISGCAPEAAGALRALEERDIRPSAIIARAGGALTAGLYACGWSAESLGRLIINMERGALALLRQALGALRSDSAPSPRDMLARVLGDAPARACAAMQPASPRDSLTALLDGLTGGVSLAQMSAGLLLPVRACSAEDARQFDLRLMRSGAGTRWALSLAEALRCAAFPGDMFTSPAVGGCLMSACTAGDILCAAEKHGARTCMHGFADVQRELSAAIAGRMLVTIAGRGQALPDQPAICIAMPAAEGGMAARMESGYKAMRAHMGAICDACL